MDIAWILTQYEQYKYPLIFLLAIPEATVLTFACGFLITVGFLDPIIVYALLVSGDAVADFLFYMLGRASTPVIVAYFYPKIGIFQERIASIGKQFESNCLQVIAISKFTSSIGIVGLVAAGTLRVPYNKFFTSCLLVSLCRIGLLLGLGFLFGRAYGQIGSYVYYYTVGMIVIVIFVFYLFWRLKKC
ncbi:MAG: hypothetical protein AAB944_01020 [Patescibacteria group bacterium]